MLCLLPETRILLNVCTKPSAQVINIIMSWIQRNILLFNMTDILPKKILARDYLKSLEQMQEEDADF